jgi:hypothetical protein
MRRNVVYTLTKANKNKALFWKIAVLGMKKPSGQGGGNPA